MGREIKENSSARYWFLLAAVIACAWLLPSTAGAASSGDDVRVKLTVMDSVGVNVGPSALAMESGPRTGQVTKIYSRGAASPFMSGNLRFRLTSNAVSSLYSGLPNGRSAAIIPAGAAPAAGGLGSASGVHVLVTML
jgi:hypothetical protein